jgi:endonuclease/exonuclease/phosphatase family metal-dependent hydrolase
MDVRLATFNLNNLFDRFNFEADLGTLPAADRNVETTYQWVFVGQGTGPDDPPPQLDEPSSSTPIVRIQKGVRGELIEGKPAAAQQALAARIAAVDADVLALQEVENLDALRRFNRDLLAQPYPYEVLIEGNDPRFIDVAVLSRLPTANVTTHRFEVHPAVPTMPVFGRDLLELQVFNATRRRRLLILFVTHLKSKFIPFDDPDPAATAQANDELRTRQAETIARVVADRTRPDARYVVLGDLNDAPEAGPLTPMVSGLELVDGLDGVIESRPPPPATPENSPTTVRWTHRHSVANAPDTFELFDQIWLSPGLAGRVTHAEIERRRAWHASSAGVGSDHDPAWIRLDGL